MLLLLLFFFNLVYIAFDRFFLFGIWGEKNASMRRGGRGKVVVGEKKRGEDDGALRDYGSGEQNNAKKPNSIQDVLYGHS